MAFHRGEGPVRVRNLRQSGKVVLFAEELLSYCGFCEGPSVGRMISMLVSGGVYLPIMMTMMMMTIIMIVMTMVMVMIGPFDRYS